VVFPAFGGLEIVSMRDPPAFMADRIARKADVHVEKPDGATGSRFGLSVRRAETAVIRDEFVDSWERIVSSWEGRQHLPSVWRRRPLCLPGHPPLDKR